MDYTSFPSHLFLFSCSDEGSASDILMNMISQAKSALWFEVFAVTSMMNLLSGITHTFSRL